MKMDAGDSFGVESPAMPGAEVGRRHGRGELGLDATTWCSRV